jgi:ferredoxin
MLVINPDECIDCGVCEPECPIDAIKPDSAPGMEKWVPINRDYSLNWPNITRKKPAMPEAEEMKDKPNKFETDFSDKPGTGD